MRFVFALALLVTSNISLAGEITQPQLQQELLQLKKQDQDALKEAKLSKQELLDLQTKHTEILKGLVRNYGWPSISKVGESAAQGAWLLVQHADHDRQWQREVLAMMEELATVNDIDKSNIAYLRDRLSIAENQTQLYGSQGRCVEKDVWQPFNILAPEKIEIRRAEMNMTTLPEYITRASYMCRNFVVK